MKSGLGKKHFKLTTTLEGLISSNFEHELGVKQASHHFGATYLGIGVNLVAGPFDAYMAPVPRQ